MIFNKRNCILTFTPAPVPLRSIERTSTSSSIAWRRAWSSRSLPLVVGSSRSVADAAADDDDAAAAADDDDGGDDDDEEEDDDDAILWSVSIG